MKDLRREFDFSLLLLMETHVSGTRAAKIIKSLGFDGNLIQEADGQAGGIWCLWDQNFWLVDLIPSPYQFLHV